VPSPLAIALFGLLAAAAVLAIIRARAERALRETAQFAREILDNTGEGIVAYDRDMRYVLWNRFMEELSGLPASEVIGRPAAELFPHFRDQHVDALIQRALNGETVSSADIHYEVPSTGRAGWVSSIYRPHYDNRGNVVGVIGLVRDISERKAAEQQIEYQAYHDALTGLANRRLFHEHLSLALKLAQRRDGRVAVLFLDLDHFKLINDSLGHSTGDALLVQVAKRLKQAVREGDTVARVGGDEFTIVLQELERREDAASVAQKVLRAIAEPIAVNGHRLYVTTSVGITVYPDDGEDAETLLKNADAAMYRAKSEGRNTFYVASAELSRTTSARMQVESGLHRAMESREFEIHYQPQIDVAAMRVVGMEALLRWNDPERGMIGPADFIGVAEERGMITLIGDWVLREACREVKRFHERGLRDFRVAVNISARQFRDRALLWTIEAALGDSGIDPRCLELEITESAAMEDVNATIAMVNDLRASGVTVAIDDFGTGHSSLAYLKQFKVDALKIDKSFVADLPDSLEDSAIVLAIIGLANGLGLRIVAEGVETRAQLDFLRHNGCREVQGFYFGNPVAVSEIEKLV
jgi:diguanylate cyclase (GGDEF)-like protein/PAS domain S-box-containing protein